VGLAGLGDKILGLYAGGMTVRDSQRSAITRPVAASTGRFLAAVSSARWRPSARPIVRGLTATVRRAIEGTTAVRRGRARAARHGRASSADVAVVRSPARDLKEPGGQLSVRGQA
jgi:hypothetical protein